MEGDEKRFDELETYHHNKELGEKIQRDVDSFVEGGTSLVDKRDYEGLNKLLGVFEKTFKEDVARLRISEEDREGVLNQLETLKATLEEGINV
tara:strand:+ start:2143 stop:2421 length:279 start_codon:yes stop_codon:yes gene_type:complete